MYLKYMLFLGACYITLWVLGRAIEPQDNQGQEVGPHMNEKTNLDPALDDLHQMEG
jgi:hypothetical protein